MTNKVYVATIDEQAVLAIKASGMFFLMSQLHAVILDADVAPIMRLVDSDYGTYAARGYPRVAPLYTVAYDGHNNFEIVVSISEPLTGIKEISRIPLCTELSLDGSITRIRPYLCPIPY